MLREIRSFDVNIMGHRSYRIYIHNDIRTKVSVEIGSLLKNSFAIYIFFYFRYFGLTTFFIIFPSLTMTGFSFRSMKKSHYD